LIEDRFSGTTQTLDFYHASQRLWELANYLYANDAEAARLFVEPLLHQLRHGESSRVIHAPRVMGAGPIGIVTALAAIAGGCSQVVITDIQHRSSILRLPWTSPSRVSLATTASKPFDITDIIVR
jgi:hypothetical protein